LTKGEHYVPATVHKSLRWGKSDQFALDSDTTDIPWHVLTKSDKSALVNSVKSSFVPAQGSSLDITPSTLKKKISGSSVPLAERIKGCPAATMMMALIPL
jgi:hypothetical protein